MNRLLIVLSMSALSLIGMQEEYWSDSTFSLEELEEQDPGRGTRMLCEQILQECDLKNLNNYDCRLRHHLNLPRGGWFMDIYIKEKLTQKDVCAFELNRQTKIINRLY